ncbi:MAG: site-specific integrase [Deltaproteobacteria bacterium]|jgi:integrase|nr:site-specific integrase [Deltaproteobacteria bacterium]
MSRINVKKYKGVFYREVTAHDSPRADRSFDICWYEDGKKMWLTTGRASEGMTAEESSKIRMEILTKPKDEKQNLTVDKVLDLWEKAKSSRQVSSRINIHLRPALGKLKMSELTTPHVEAIVSELLATGRSPMTANIAANTLSAAINNASRLGLWEGKNPASKAAGLRLPKLNNKGERYFTKEEADSLINELGRHSSWWADAASVSLYTGARLTEIYRMRAADLDEESGTIMITAKGGGREPLLLVKEATEILLNRIKTEPRADGLIFGRRRSDTIQKVIADLGLNAGVTDPRQKAWFHTFRHTFASWLVQNGADLYTVQKLMRHKNIMMTQRYAHLRPSDQREKLEIIRAIMNPKD